MNMTLYAKWTELPPNYKAVNIEWIQGAKNKTQTVVHTETITGLAGTAGTADRNMYDMGKDWTFNEATSDDPSFIYADGVIIKFFYNQNNTNTGGSNEQALPSQTGDYKDIQIFILLSLSSLIAFIFVIKYRKHKGI